MPYASPRWFRLPAAPAGKAPLVVPAATLLPVALVATVLLVALNGPAGAVSIGDLHCNDSSGVPAAPYTIGTTVTVSGIVTTGTGTFTSTYTDVWLQDPTGGIEIYGSGFPTTFALGDSFSVTGTIGQYNGNTEVVYSSSVFHGSGYDVPEPLVLTCYEADHSFGGDQCEPNESRLIRINNVSLGSAWPSGGNGTATLVDSTGTCTLYIDADTGVQGVTPPGGLFDVIGILKQYDYAAPYTSGYEIIPRYPSDIVILPGPQITAGPEETDIRSDRVTIEWTTDTPSSSRVEFGLTDSYELGAVEDPAEVTEHSLVLDGLQSARIHHYRVSSANQHGATQSGDKLFCSASGPEATGEIQVFFNKTVDTSLAMGIEAQGVVNLPTRLVERINAAQYSIDICLYSFDLVGLADALINAKNRGVEVRFIYDNRATYQTQVQRLITAGIPVIDDSYGNNSGNEIMHNKFWIFDHRAGSPDQSDDWVWTGSLNCTSEGAYTDAQNVVVIQDAALAEAYQAEFDEMWGSSTLVPNPTLSRFGANKLDNTPKKFNVAGVPMRLYFSPSDGVINAAVAEVERADASIHFCILSYTRADLAAAMQEKWYNLPGFELRGVFDHAEIGNTYSQYHDMAGTGDAPWDPPADVWLDQEAGSLHHKYMIVDATSPEAKPTVVTGSANWSTSAQDSNDENMLIIQSFPVANQFYQEFAERYHAAGGSGPLTTDAPVLVPASGTVRLRTAPNPARGRITVSWALPQDGSGRIALYGPSGRLERVLAEGALRGEGRLELDLGSDHSLANGVHFLRLETERYETATRVLIVR